MTDSPKIESGQVGRTMSNTGRFRLVNTGPRISAHLAPKLQAAWQDLGSGEIVWVDVPIEVVSNEEFIA